ncbi:MAG: zf-HC2 domain-containing protein [Terracidiphilus sp.]
MNSTSQLDLHPDAESLNAFVEQALPERERGQILAHLATCGRCRQVIYLAQEAAGEVETAGAFSSEPAAVQKDGGRISSWFKGWRVAWVPAAALAAVVGVAVVVQFKHGEPNSQSGPRREQEMAKVEPQPKIQVDAGKGAGSSIGTPPASTVSARQFEKKTLSANALAELRAIPPPAPSAPAPHAEVGAADVANDKLDGAVSRSGAVFHGSAMQSPSVHGPAPQMQQTWSGQQQAAPSPQAPSAAAAGSFMSTDANSVDAKKASAAEVVQSTPAVSMTDQETAEFAPRGVSRAGSVAAKRQSAAPVFALKVTPLKLPSGLTVLSVATGQHRTLAIDAGGVVFLRKNAEPNWEAVKATWTGRAVLVRFRDTASKASGVLQAGQAGKNVDGPLSKANEVDEYSAGAVSGTKAPAGVFEIETDSGKVWVSADGNEWKAK